MKGDFCRYKRKRKAEEREREREGEGFGMGNDKLYSEEGNCLFDLFPIITFK